MLSLLLASSFWNAGLAAPLFQDGVKLPNACGTNDGCWTNYLRVTDIDGDGDLDIVMVNMKGLFSVGKAEPLVIYANDGKGNFTNVSKNAVADHVGQHRQVAIGDIDSDGDADVFAPQAKEGKDILFMNQGDGTFAPHLMANGSSAGAARFADFDNDGDLDLLLTDGYAANKAPTQPGGHLFLNDGKGAFTELADAGIVSVDGNQPIDVDVLDADGDFDLDILINAHQKHNALYLNDGSGHFKDASEGVPKSGGNHYNPAVCDVDGDGDLDIWIDNGGRQYTEQLFINDGSGKYTDETVNRVKGNTKNADDNGVVCVDLDQDGDFDAIVVALTTGERYLENDGTGYFTQVDGVIPGKADSSLWAELGDLDGDGRQDLVTGSGEGGSIDTYYLGSSEQAVDTAPPKIRSVQSVKTAEAGESVVLRFGVSDISVTDEGPRLGRAFVRGSLDGTPFEVPALFVGGDLFRSVLPPAWEGSEVVFEACAVDSVGNMGCSAPQSYNACTTSSSGSACATQYLASPTK